MFVKIRHFSPSLFFFSSGIFLLIACLLCYFYMLRKDPLLFRLVDLTIYIYLKDV